MMVLIVIGFVSLTVLFVITRLLSRLGAKRPQLGTMSPQWLAEQRQSHSH